MAKYGERQTSKWRTTPAPKPKWARRDAHEEIEIYLNGQVTAFKDYVMEHVPHYIIEEFLHRQWSIYQYIF